MDYSLILAKIDLQVLNRNEIKLLRKKGHFIRKNKKIGYIIGIIDILSSWTWDRQVEKFVKLMKNCNPYLDISCQPPETYAKRFKDFIENHIFPLKIIEDNPQATYDTSKTDL